MTMRVTLGAAAATPPVSSSHFFSVCSRVTISFTYGVASKSLPPALLNCEVRPPCGITITSCFSWLSSSCPSAWSSATSRTGATSFASMPRRRSCMCLPAPFTVLSSVRKPANGRWVPSVWPCRKTTTSIGLFAFSPSGTSTIALPIACSELSSGMSCQPFCSLGLRLAPVPSFNPSSGIRRTFPTGRSSEFQS